MRRICIYCGSNLGVDPAYRDAAAAVGTYCAQHGIGVVYGGGSVGLMGAVADAALAAGGEVIGVIPRKLVTLEKEHRGLTRLFEVDTMHQRKKLMMDQSDGFLALPGGYGTLEELFEAVAWLQLGYHRKPVGLWNVAGYYDPLVAMLESMERGGLLKLEHRAMLLVDHDLETIIARMKNFEASDVEKWL